MRISRAQTSLRQRRKRIKDELARGAVPWALQVFSMAGFIEAKDLNQRVQAMRVRLGVAGDGIVE